MLKEGIAGGIKVDYRQKGNTMPKAFAQQQIICALIRDNSLYNDVRTKLSADNFTDGDMKRAYNAFVNSLVLPYKYSQFSSEYLALSRDVSKTVA